MFVFWTRGVWVGGMEGVEGGGLVVGGSWGGCGLDWSVERRARDTVSSGGRGDQWRGMMRGTDTDRSWWRVEGSRGRRVVVSSLCCFG